MVLKYFTFSLSLVFISWIIGIIANALLARTQFYKTRLSNLLLIRNEWFGRMIGLDAFRWVVQNSFFKYFNPKLSMKKRIRPSELDSLRNEMTVAEIGHLCGFLFVIPFVVVKLGKGDWLFATIMILVNILMNLYPLLLQQENKRRIDWFREKINSKRLKP
ncbi:hypothetical protein VRU48_09670 [Pedobacter sp. KR3-3]|uniref:Glycosyl-4,4'-diaponeurosporenoate acyltransferase n=1 Tax=Pedobacter albus TaxID=3113905 RepID=A0ABU7I7D8_9SPHI|nr:hypothetical protein [Pedobacter sp. KR3-3]MEE1945376.1 hypothetical protein [Pedobacter sp. KR3-3]